MVASRFKIKTLRLLLNILKRILNFMIYIVFKVRSKEYGVYISEAFLLPWENDKEFKNVLSQIKPLTMLDESRLYTLWSLIESTQKIKGNIFEIGTWKGGASLMMSKKIYFQNSNKYIYGFDTFKGVVKTSDVDINYKDEMHNDSNFEKLIKDANQMELKNIKIFKGIFPDDFKKPEFNYLFDDGISLIHIDIDIYNSVKDTFMYIWDKVHVGGCVVFDDYGFHQPVGVRKFVDEIKNNISCNFLYLTTGQALIIKR